MAYTHLLFDHDGVLVNTEPLYLQAIQEQLATLGIELLESDYIKGMATGADPWALARAAGKDEAAIAQLRGARDTRYQQLLRSQPIRIPQADEVIAVLAEHFQLAIVTTSRDEDFDLIHPEPYLLALSRFGIEPAKALVIEDSERGLRAAVAAGIDCAALYHPFTAAQNFDKARYRFESLQTLQRFLLNQ